jgi:penicillin-binding protein A
MNRHFLINSYPSRKSRKRRLLRLRYLLLALILYAGWHFIFADPAGDGGEARENKAVSTASPARPAPPVKQALPGAAARATLTKKDLVNIDEELIKTRNLTIDWGLQQFIADLGARYKLYHGAIAGMDAQSGAILALYGQMPDGQDCTLPLDTEPAASIFKVVTATAAMEQGGFTDQSIFFYTGNAHTLYKNQLTNKRNKWCADISLADAFARSNNIVFGKLGIIYLGQAPIFLTAKRLGFWKSPLKEFHSDPSTSFFPKDEYNLAELACGFNTSTRMSPLHAAQMVTPALNGGAMVTPRIVRTSPVEKIQVMRTDTASRLNLMMAKTIKSGTVCRTFRGMSSDHVLKNIDVGGKSGSIDGTEPAGRRNWFVGYALNRYTGQGITVGCCLILKDHFWIEADMLTRLVVRNYFSGLPSGAPPAQPKPASKLTASRSKGKSKGGRRT